MEQPKNEVLNLLANALGIGTDSSHQDDTAGQGSSSTNTVLLGGVGTFNEDTSSTPATSKYTQLPGAETVVEMVQDCFQAMDDVIETGIRSTPSNFTEVKGAETVVRMVQDCFETHGLRGARNCPKTLAYGVYPHFQDSAQELKKLSTGPMLPV
ncbi:hypothetical protein MRX96_055736 [Rhipicephalus microplus]